MTEVLKTIFERLKIRIEDEKSRFKYVNNNNDAIVGGTSFIWIGTEDNLIGDLNCHYEFIYRKYYNNEIILTGVHIENPDKKFLFEKLKSLFKKNNLDKIPKTYNINLDCHYYLENGIPINDENLVEKAYQQLVKLDKKVGEEIKRIIKMNDNKALIEAFDLLTNSHNIILHGAPGTGKTYLAKQIAEAMGAETCFVQFHPSYDYTDFVEGLRPVNKEGSKEIGFERKDGIFKQFCIKALTNLIDSQKKGSAENQETKKKNFVFIIDEINRGELSKIFGELFFSIDPGYRVYFEALPKQPQENGNKEKDDSEQKNNNNKDNQNQNKKEIITIKTQYSNMQENPNEFDKALGVSEDKFKQDDYGHFFVPENVYIIGTMNDIDRNVESMDFAFRRRFAFKEIKATDTQNMLDNHKGLNGTKPEETIIDVKTQQGTVKTTVIDRMKNRMNNLNNAISGIDGLSSAYHIGASYFLQFKLPSDYKDKNEEKEKKNAENAAFEDLWNYHLEPLLQEYLRGMEDADSKLKALKAAYENDNKAE
jgi:hypothetical protein